ncbi:MAG TPA: plastocyanin/azurin family copper-binding protein [Chroococcales cyanobacterium]|jgi:plastocyanin
MKNFRMPLFLSALLLVACGGAPAKTPANPSVDQDNRTVVVRDFEFVPATLEVPAGSTVVWSFQGPTPHSVLSDPGSAAQWDSGVLAAGKTYSRRFDTAGTFPYHCAPHPFMKGSIVVR